MKYGKELMANFVLNYLYFNMQVYNKIIITSINSYDPVN